MDQSQDATAWLWDFAGLGSSTSQDPSFTFPQAEEGHYEVCLTASSAPSCADSACAVISVLMGPTVFVPNTFTPDGDGMNDDFGPSVLGVTGYLFSIYDRWGHGLFESTDPGNRWNGSFASGDPAPQGVYVWKLLADDPYGTERIERTGHVTLLR
jgi:gliding motility-associated-like protein